TKYARAFASAAANRPNAVVFIASDMASLLLPAELLLDGFRDADQDEADDYYYKGDRVGEREVGPAQERAIEHIYGKYLGYVVGASPCHRPNEGEARKRACDAQDRRIDQGPGNGWQHDVAPDLALVGSVYSRRFDDLDIDFLHVREENDHVQAGPHPEYDEEDR